MTSFGVGLLDLIERSIIVQSLVTLALVGVVCYMYVTGAEVPEGLSGLTYAVVGYWFGTKAQHTIDSQVRKRRG